MNDWLTVTRQQAVRWEADCVACHEPIRPRVQAFRLRDLRGRPSWAHATCLPGAHRNQQLCPVHLTQLHPVEQWNAAYTKKDTVDLVCHWCNRGDL